MVKLSIAPRSDNASRGIVDGADAIFKLPSINEVAKIASHYQIEEVIDNLVISLCKFTALLSEKTPNAQVTMSEDTKAVLAVVTVFCIANKHGDNIRSGWRNIVDCIVRLHKLKLLPANVTEIEEMKDVLKFWLDI